MVPAKARQPRLRRGGDRRENDRAMPDMPRTRSHTPAVENIGTAIAGKIGYPFCEEGDTTRDILA